MQDCKTCGHKNVRHWMKTSPKATALLARKRYMRRKTRQEWLEQRKQGPCVDCGGQWPACAMHFDHIGHKRAGLAKMVTNGASFALMEAEIAKCELVCACCHAIRTFERKQHKTRPKKYSWSGSPETIPQTDLILDDEEARIALGM